MIRPIVIVAEGRVVWARERGQLLCSMFVRNTPSPCFGDVRQSQLKLSRSATTKQGGVLSQPPKRTSCIDMFVIRKPRYVRVSCSVERGVGGCGRFAAPWKPWLAVKRLALIEMAEIDNEHSVRILPVSVSQRRGRHAR